MTWRMVGVLVLLAVMVDVHAQGPTPTRSEPIRGRIVDAGSGVPLRRARVIVTAGNRPLSSVFTDDEGRFAMTNLPATPLSLRASKAGYASSLVTVAVAGPGTELRFAMTKSAAVSGRVVDARGGPPVGVFVTAQMVRPPGSSEPAEATQFFTQIDLMGDYRIGGLPAGRYEITAVHLRPESWRPGTRVEDQVFGPPESLDTGRASIVSLSSGDEVLDVNLSIAGTPETCPTGPSVRPAPGSVAASVSGRVTAATGEPIACAAVYVVAPDVGIERVYTDQQGRYLIDGLRAGTFVLEARRLGHTAIRYGQRRPSDAVTPISLRAGQRRTGTDFVLPGPSVISGTIVDEHGEPIEGVGMWAVQLRRVDGRITAMSNALPQRTDDRGQYRLIGVEPGTYVISASGREKVSDGESARGYVTTYYPGVPDVAGARRITLSAGEAVPGLDMTLTPARTVTVSGMVLNSAGLPFPGMVTLEVSTRSGAVSIDSWSAVADASGRFSIANVPAGDYAVKASESFDRPGGFGMQRVTVVDRDPPPLNITLSGGATIEGRIVIEGDSPNVAGLGISVASVDWDYAPFARRGTMWARQSDGSFRATGVTGPSRITITETPACEGCYLKSALVNGIETVHVPFDFGITGVYRDVEVVVSDAGGVIEGRVTDGRDQAAPAFSLVVFPTSRDLWYPRSRALKVQQSRPDGSARVTGLPPGDYYVVAVNRFDSLPLGGELSDPDVLEELSRGAQQVTLNERDRRALTLKLVRRQANQP